jgi:hypothetical protein
MGIESVGWALRQKLPGTAKLVLIALCNHADDDTGHCWPSADLIARHASCSRRSVFTYLAALRRNGYVEYQSARRPTGEQRSNNYWVLFDRPDIKWVFAPKDEPLDVDSDAVDNSVDNTEFAPSDDCEQQETQPRDSVESTRFALGQSATGCTLLEPSELEPSESSTRLGAETPPPKHLARDPQALASARQQSQGRLQASEEARSKNQVVPVIEGTESWKAWVAHGHKPTLTCNLVVKGRPDRGWYFRTLWPPRSTGPPDPVPGCEFADEFEDATEG